MIVSLVILGHTVSHPMQWISALPLFCQLDGPSRCSLAISPHYTVRSCKLVSGTKFSRRLVDSTHWPTLKGADEVQRSLLSLHWACLIQLRADSQASVRYSANLVPYSYALDNPEQPLLVVADHFRTKGDCLVVRWANSTYGGTWWSAILLQQLAHKCGQKRPLMAHLGEYWNDVIIVYSMM